LNEQKTKLFLSKGRNKPMSKDIKNELNAELLAANSFNPFHENTSAQRGQMYTTHLGQMLVLNGSTPRLIQTGIEREYGKYTFKVDMPVTGLILDIIPRYQQGAGVDAIHNNPQTIVIYEDIETKELGIIDIVDYSCNHQYFGFRYKKQPGMNNIRIGQVIEKGTVFLNSPSITEEGDYAYGIEANVAYMTHPATAEDGILISRDFLPKLGFKTYESRTIGWGKDCWALNLYGDKDNYKPFPEIGDAVREDGLVMALRTYEYPILAIVEQSVADCMEPDYTFDQCTYAQPGGRVIDIKINHHLQDNNCAEVHMDNQAQRYDKSYRMFCKRIMDAWKKYHKLRGNALMITPQFHSLVVAAQSVCSDEGDQRVNKIHRKTPLNIYSIDIVIEYDIEPDVGFKATDCFGK
jgi:hypothetical protein